MTSEVSRTSKGAKLLIFPRGWYFWQYTYHISLKVSNQVYEYGYWTYCVYLERNNLSLECNRTGWQQSKPFLMEYSAICRGQRKFSTKSDALPFCYSVFHCFFVSLNLLKLKNLKLLYCSVFPDFRKSSAFCKVSTLRPFVLPVRTSCRWIWV